MKQFRKKMGHHTAVQFTGTNVAEVVKFTNGLARTSAFPDMLLLSSIVGETVVRVSDVIVKDPQGYFRRYSQDSFKAIFEEVSEE